MVPTRVVVQRLPCVEPTNSGRPVLRVGPWYRTIVRLCTSARSIRTILEQSTVLYDTT